MNANDSMELVKTGNKFCGCKMLMQAELERVQNESLELVRERDRMKDEITTLGNSCRDKSDEIDRLNHQLTANSAQLQVKTIYLCIAYVNVKNHYA